MSTTATEGVPSEWKALIEAELKQSFGGNDTNVEIFRRMLRMTGAVVAGGFPLMCVAPKPQYLTSDMDIYCPVKYVQIVLEFLIKVHGANKNTSMCVFPSSLYSQSFLRRNGIRCVYKIGKKYDVMAVRKKRSVEAVCSNFDLTFCEIWYDGETVHATHPDHILAKKGFLRKEYIPLMIQRNAFLVKRALKYIERNFTIEYDPDYVPQPPPPVSTLLPHSYYLSTQPLHCEPIVNTPQDFEHRFVRHMLRWFEQYNYFTDSMTRTLFINPYRMRPFVFQKHGCIEHSTHSRYHHHPINRSLVSIWQQIIKENHPFVPDGYDSEDMDANDYALIKKRLYIAIVEKPEYKGDEEIAPDTERKEVWFWRFLNRMYFHYVKEEENGYETVVKMLPREERTRIIQTRILPFVKYLYEHCMRKGADAITGDDDAVLFDIHQHPLGGAISREGMEGYLTDHIRDVDKDSVPCYYRPNTDGHGNCKRPISLKEAKMIVSPAFYKRYSAPFIIHLGLDQIVPAYDSLLFNTKTPDATFGILYHISICPFCLQVERREDGCTYLTHDNPKGLSPDKSPYCSSQFLVDTILEKYKEFVKAIPITDDFDRRFPQHYQFCAECGAPCINHRHFDLEHPGQLLPEIVQHGRHDYGTCPGGKRRSLVARALAIREVFANDSIKHSKEERFIAAEQAELAAIDPAYLARADAILAIAAPAAQERQNILERRKQGPLTRENDETLRRLNAMVAPWNRPVPSEKQYNEEEPEPVVAAPARNENAEEKEDDLFAEFRPQPNNNVPLNIFVPPPPLPPLNNIENNANGVGNENHQNLINALDRARHPAVAAPAAPPAAPQNIANGFVGIHEPPNAQPPQPPQPPPPPPPAEGGRRRRRRSRKQTVKNIHNRTHRRS